MRYDGVPISRPFVYAEPYYEILADPDDDPWWSFWVGYELRWGLGRAWRILDYLRPRSAYWFSSLIDEDRRLIASADTFATSEIDWEGVRWSQGYDFDAIETARRVVPTLDAGNPGGLVVVGTCWPMASSSRWTARGS